MASNEIANETENVTEAVTKRQLETKIPKPSFCTWKKKKSSILHRNNKSDFEEHTKSGLHLKFAHKIRMRSKNLERTLHKLTPVDDIKEDVIAVERNNGADSPDEKETVVGIDDTEKISSGVAENSGIGSENDDLIADTENVGDAKPADLKLFIDCSEDRGDSVTCEVKNFLNGIDLKSKDVNLVIKESIDDCSECPVKVFEDNSVADEHSIKPLELKVENSFKCPHCKSIDNDFKNLDNVGEENSVSDSKIVYEGSENCDNGSKDKTISSTDLNPFVEVSANGDEDAGKHLD